MFVKNLFCLATGSMMLAAALPARADDTSKRYGLDPDFPVRVEDAYPTKFGDAYVRYTSRFSHNRDGTDQTTAQPEVAVGWAPNLDLHINQAYIVGDADHSGSGDTNANVQWLFLDEKEGQWWPALAVEGGLIFPTGRESEGVDTSLQFLATKTIDWAPHFDELHLNVSWQHNSDAAGDQRSDYYLTEAGYSRRLVAGIVLDSDVYWEQNGSHRSNSQGVEVGLIFILGDHVLLASGVSGSLGDDSAPFEATLGIIVKK